MPLGLGCLTRRDPRQGHRFLSAPVFEINGLLFARINFQQADPTDNARDRRSPVIADDGAKRQSITDAQGRRGCWGRVLARL
jgi:hypothetical protein